MKILLDRVMKQKQLSERQVTMLTGIPKTSINNILNGRVSPTMETMERLAAGLKVKIEDLYESDFK